MTTIVIDKPALFALLDADPDFRLRITDAVISHVVRKIFDKDAERIIRSANPALFDGAVKALQENDDIQQIITAALSAKMVKRNPDYYSTRSRWLLSTEAKTVIDEAIAEGVGTLTERAGLAVTMAITGRAEELIQEKLGNDPIDDRIARRLDGLTNRMIEERAQKLFDAKMAELRKAVS